MTLHGLVFFRKLDKAPIGGELLGLLQQVCLPCREEEDCGWDFGEDESLLSQRTKTKE